MKLVTRFELASKSTSQLRGLYRDIFNALGGVILPAKNVMFFKKDGKLRVNLLDNDKTEYDVRVPANICVTFWIRCPRKNLKSLNRTWKTAIKGRTFALGLPSLTFIKTVIVI